MTDSTGVVAVGIKVLCLGTMVGTAAALTPSLVGEQRYLFLTFVWVIIAVVLSTYATRRAVPAKYLVPGTLLLVLFVVTPVLATLQLSTTNYGDGTRTSKEADHRPHSRQLGRAGRGLPGVQPGGGHHRNSGVRARSPSSWSTRRAAPSTPAPRTAWSNWRTGGDARRGRRHRGPRVHDADAHPGERRGGDPAGVHRPHREGAIRHGAFGRLSRGRTVLKYDEAEDTITDTQTGAVRTPPSSRATGSTSSPDGTRCLGAVLAGQRRAWPTYRKASPTSGSSSDFVAIFIWTVVFATRLGGLYVPLGLVLAVVLNDDRECAGQKIYRSVLLLPYAIPGFISHAGLAGLFNQRLRPDQQSHRAATSTGSATRARPRSPLSC